MGCTGSAFSKSSESFFCQEIEFDVCGLAWLAFMCQGCEITMNQLCMDFATHPSDDTSNDRRNQGERNRGCYVLVSSGNITACLRFLSKILAKMDCPEPTIMNVSDCGDRSVLSKRSQCLMIYVQSHCS